MSETSKEEKQKQIWDKIRKALINEKEIGDTGQEDIDRKTIHQE